MLIPVYYNTDETAILQDTGLDDYLSEDQFEIRYVSFQADKINPLQPIGDFYGKPATKIGANGDWFTTPIEMFDLLQAIGEVLAMPLTMEEIATPYKINLN